MCVCVYLCTVFLHIWIEYIEIKICLFFFILAQKMLLCVSLDVIFCYSFIPFLLCLLFVCVCAFGHNIIELCHISKPMCLCLCLCMHVLYVLSLSGMAERNAWSRTRFAILWTNFVKEISMRIKSHHLE